MKDLWMTGLTALVFVALAIGSAGAFVWLSGVPERQCVERATEWAYGPSGLSREERAEFLEWASEKGC